MAVPEFQAIMLPMLQLASDGKVHSLSEAREALAAHFALTDAERAELLPSGRQRRFDNRVAWAKVYLERGVLVSSPSRAHFEITDRGREVLSRDVARVDIAFLEQFEEFNAFRNSGNKGGAPTGPVTVGPVAETPEEVLECRKTPKFPHV